jgi:hypothetical protein
LVLNARPQESSLLAGTQKSKLALLRIANGLLRRLSKALNTGAPLASVPPAPPPPQQQQQQRAWRRRPRGGGAELCGRILIFLAYVFPLSERSGVNVRGEFNTENVTDYEGADAPSAAAGAGEGAVLLLLLLLLLLCVGV